MLKKRSRFHYSFFRDKWQQYPLKIKTGLSWFFSPQITAVKWVQRKRSIQFFRLDAKMTAGFNKNQDSRTCFGLVFFFTKQQITAPPQLSKGWSRMKVDDLSLWMRVESNYCLPALGAFTISRRSTASWVHCTVAMHQAGAAPLLKAAA